MEDTMTTRSFTHPHGEPDPRDDHGRDAGRAERRDSLQEPRADHRPPWVVFMDGDDDDLVRPSRGNRWLPPEAPSVQRAPDLDLEHAALSWAWERRFPSYRAAVRGLAQLLHALETSGFMERVTIRQAGQPIRRVFRLTEPGVEFADVLAGQDLPPEVLR
jgi:hypothetical protein